MSVFDENKGVGGKISTPIHQMMENPKLGRVIFKVGSFRQKFNTRTAALGHKSRWGYDIYTKGHGEHEVHVIKRGSEDLDGITIDLTEYDEE